MSAPTVVAAFTVTGSGITLTAGFYTASHGTSLTFVNGTTTNNAANPISYLWNFGSGSNPTSNAVNPAFVFSVANTYTVVLGATGSFNITNAGIRKIQIT